MSLESNLKSQVLNFVRGRLEENDKEEILKEASKILNISPENLAEIITSDEVSTMDFLIYEAIFDVINIKPEIYFE